MSQISYQGWQSPKHQINIEEDKLLITKYKQDLANSILKQPKHTLQPDMINGWKPKLASCPLPLTYKNQFNQKLIQHVSKDDRYKIVYIGKRYVNSVHVNQQNKYYWKYRQRYGLNTTLINESLKNNIGISNSFQEQYNSCKQNLSQKQLKFDSSFESGNLQLAIKIKANQYDLFLRSDTNTKGHTNWYYFKVENQDFVGTAQINICNIGKSKTLYNKGMKPYVREETNQNKLNDGFEQDKKEGKNSRLKRQTQKWSQDKTFDVIFVERYCRYGTDKKHYQVQFKYNFKQPNQKVYFAYGIPYTYSDLQTFINQISTQSSDIIQTQKLCESLGGLSLPLLTITSPDFFQIKNSQRKIHLNSFNKQNESLELNSHDLTQKQILPFLKQKNSNSVFEMKKDNTKAITIQNNCSGTKKAILITCRIHPGQSNASHVLQGFIRQLLGMDEVSKKIRQKYVFYIIPMLNPDGVVIGNFRTSYSGKDLNRQFNKLNNQNSKFIYPQICAFYQFAQKLKLNYKKRLEYYFDFHGHSSKKNLFCYGPQYDPSNILFFKCRTFAKVLEETNPIFNYRKSIFHISQHKKTTARAYMLCNIKIPMTYTFQISNGLYQSNKQNKNVQLDKGSMNEAGSTIYKGFCKYVCIQTRNFGIGYQARAKVDTGIRSKRILSFSQKNMRQKSSKLSFQEFRMKKNSFQLASQKVIQIGQNKMTNQQCSIQQNLQSAQLQKYIKQIRRQSNIEINSEPQGGSDSEGSEQDLSTEQLSKLHQFVKRKSQKQLSVQNERRRKLRSLNNSFKIKQVIIKKQNQLRNNERKRMFDQTDDSNKENNSKSINNINISLNKNKTPITTIDPLESGRRLHKLGQKLNDIFKRPPLPLPIAYQKVVVHQKQFTMEL